MIRVLGLDLGSKTVGIAVSDNLGMLAHAVETFRFEENRYDIALKYILDKIKEYECEVVVLGLPRHMNGDVGIRGNISIDFKAKLEANCSVNVILIDERLSSVMMEKSMIKQDFSRKKRKEKIDQMAAVVILQSYLDQRR